VVCRVMQDATDVASTVVDSSLLGCGTALQGKWSSTFLRHLSPSSFRAQGQSTMPERFYYIMPSLHNI